MSMNGPVRSWLLRARLQSNNSILRHRRVRSIWRRHESTQSEARSAKTISRLDRFIAKTPTAFLRTRLSALKNAPVSHIVSFLILHEFTAIVPLFGLTAAFHYFQYLPATFAQGDWAVSGVKKFGNYARKKGWISSEDAEDAKIITEQGRALEVENVKSRESRNDSRTKWWNRSEDGTRLVVEFATAYAVVKVLFPLRIMASVWAAPSFATWIMMPIGRLISKPFGR